MDHSNDRLIGALVADLRPVRPLLPPALRALIWLTFVAAVAVAIAMFADVGGGVASHHRDPGHVACGAWLDRDYGAGSVRRV